MRKARRTSSVPLSVKLSSKKVREKFRIAYELEGCQKAVNFLSEYYKVRKMKIILNGKMFSKKKTKSWLAYYESYKEHRKKQRQNRCYLNM